MDDLISADSPPVLHLMKDWRLAYLIKRIGDIERRQHRDAFPFIAGEIVEQMLSLKAAECIRNRIRGLCGGELTPDALIGLSHDDLRGAGLSRTKADALIGFAAAVRDGAIDFKAFRTLSDAEIIAKLTRLRGIGPWTAKMYLIFVLQREDVLPYEDGAFMTTFKWLYGMPRPSKQDVLAKCRKWQPYSSIAACYLYRAHDMGMHKLQRPRKS